MPKFDFYEFAGILTPGLFLIACLSLIFEPVAGFVDKTEFSLGDFGLIVAIGYVVGHLVQGIGNGLETVYRSVIGGKPTDWVREHKKKIISNGQRARLEEILRPQLRMEKVTAIRELDAAAWDFLVKEMYTEIKAAGCDGRAFIFRGNYGLFRGISAALLVILVSLLATEGLEAWIAESIAAGALVLAIWRMHRFAKNLAREILIQYIKINSEPEVEPAGILTDFR